MDVSVSFPQPGRIRVESRTLFADSDGESCRFFLEHVVGTHVIKEVTVHPQSRRQRSFAEIRYCAQSYSAHDVLEALTFALQQASLSVDDDASAAPSQTSVKQSNGKGRKKSRPGKKKRSRPAPKASETQDDLPPDDDGFTDDPGLLDVLHLSPDQQGVLRIYRHEELVSSWEVKHELPGRLRLANPALRRKGTVCTSIERELMSVQGVDTYKVNKITGSVLVNYNRDQIDKRQILEILDHALSRAEGHDQQDANSLDFPLCTASVPLAAAAQFMMPALLPISSAVFAYTSIYSFRQAYRVAVEERRIGVDVMDSLFSIGCLATGNVFAGSLVCWCLSLGRVLVQKTRADSQQMLLNVFGKQPRYVWKLRPDGSEVETLLDEIHAGDIVMVQTGETVPVDGVIREGLAMIDQHSLTGESTPAEKGVGEQVFASTVMIAGKIQVEVEKAGSETTSAKISRILEDSSGYKLTSQQRGEKLADRVVIPTLALGGLGMAMMGPAGAIAVLNTDLGTGIRMAAPLGMLNSLTLCARQGIFIKDGRALEQFSQVDTVLFDKTGTLTRERPEVGEILACRRYPEETILQLAAAAEQRFAHPIAKAILHKFAESGLSLPETDDSQYQVGFGITVGIEGRTVRVGSARFLEAEGIAIDDSIRQRLDEAHHAGHTLVMVGIDDELGGAIELRASQRPEVREIIAGLRARGVDHIAIISGDHEVPTRKLAEELGLDRYFAGVLPGDKADYVEQLQAEGRTVCFVGDGINDSIALKQANVSISLRGASSIATDTAQIVFMEENLSKLCDVMDISRELEQNVSRSWKLILVPNLLCLSGAFFMGFGVMASVATSNAAIIAALANGMAPLARLSRVPAALPVPGSRPAAAGEPPIVVAPVRPASGVVWERRLQPA